MWELLIDETPDRGKETRVLLDWTDPAMLRELVRRRIVVGAGLPETTFDETWRTVCVSHIDGEETSQYLIDRCLMRPSFLIDLLSHCRGFAANLRHERIEQDDIRKAVAAYSADLVADIDHDVRDVLPQAESALYAFIEAPTRMTELDVKKALLAGGIDEGLTERVTDYLVWYGALGLCREGDEVTYIYSPDVNYSSQLFNAIRRKIAAAGPVSYAVSPAFWSSLSIKH